MAIYRYLAMDSAGRKQRGELNANNWEDLSARLQRIGLDVLDAEVRASAQKRWWIKSTQRKDLVLFCFHLQQLTKAGVPLIDALNDLYASTLDLHFRDVIAALVNDVESGQVFSAALAQHPSLFDALFIKLIEAGEKSGQLPDILHNLAEDLRWQDTILQQTKQAMVYPIGVFIVISLAFLALLIFVVPQLETFLNNAGATIPWYTQPIIALSKVLKQSAFAVFFILGLMGAGVFAWWRVDARSKLWFDGIKLKVWVIGPIIRQIAFARFSRTFSLLYRAGVPILECLGMLEGVLGNKVLSIGVSNIQLAIQGGVALTEAFRRSGLFSSLVLRMIHLGENTGQLDKTLYEVSEFYTQEIRYAIANLQTLLGFVMLLVLGSLILFIAVAILFPVWDSLGKVSAI